MYATSAPIFKSSVISLAIAASFLSGNAISQEKKGLNEIEKIEVTASRRSGTVQEVPMNISALDGDIMKQQNIYTPEDVARWVPGLTIADQGGREGASIIVRGLNTNSSDRSADGGTVATYLGDIAFDSDLRLTDIQRVEVLIGPQGTLYGTGSLGGAIRYILNEPALDETTVNLAFDTFALSESDDLGTEAGVVFNLPLIEDELAVRFNLNHFSSPGFIDYTQVLKEPGVSSADPDWQNESDVNANLKTVKDANTEETFTARTAIKWVASDNVEAMLNYIYQNKKVGGNSIDQFNTLSADNPLSSVIQPYQNSMRYEEPGEQTDELLSLELTVDLGSVNLVSATGYSKFEQTGQRDQTDLLMQDIWAGYGEFPAYTRDYGEGDSLSQEFRLVSDTDSDFSWIAGVFYSDSQYDFDDREYMPGATLAWYNDDYESLDYDLEYIATGYNKSKESAVFGEFTYSATDKLEVTVGTRLYKYEVNTVSAAAAPLDVDTIITKDDLQYETVNADDSGSLFKLNLSYQLDDNILGYFTVSEGFRLGGGNGIIACTTPITAQVCALPNEVEFESDTTQNTEIGLKSTWFNNKLHFNAAIFNVDWNDAQISAATVYGAEPITLNAGQAKSQGIELSTRTTLIKNWAIFASFSYAKAELTEDAPFLFKVASETGSELQNFYDGEKGDRLPGAPEKQATFGVNYQNEVFNNKLLSVNYGLTAQSDVYTKVGLKADGESLPGYAVSNLSATISDDNWSVTAYVNNLFDKYAYSANRRDPSWSGNSAFDSENKDLSELSRTYGHYVIQPRTVGVKFNYLFDL